MSTVPEIQEAVSKLTAEELAAFRDWFWEFDGEAWDRQIEADVAAGRLEALGREVVKAHREGRCKPL